MSGPGTTGRGRRSSLRSGLEGTRAGLAVAPKGAPERIDADSPARESASAVAARDHAALAAALDPIITIDIKGVIQSASDTVERVLGWTPTELIGRNVNMLMPEPHHSAHDGYLASYERTGRTSIMDRPRRFEAMRKDGSLVPIELCVSRANISGAAPMFVGIIRDMSAYAAAERSRDEERVRYQQLLAEQTSALQTAHLRLRMADRMASIGTLAAGLGHDMNNVLLPVRARLNALKAAGDGGRLSASERKHVEEVGKSVAYLQQLADGLHFLALDPETEEDARGGGAATDLASWWKQAGPLLSKAVPKHVRVVASIADHLPPVAVAAHGLTQAVLNLVVNAGEAIPPPTVRKRKQGFIRINANAGKTDSRPVVRLSIADNGTGMSEDVQRRAFDMFFTTKPRGLGTGLGLALVRNVLDRAGGSVEIESEVGKGTTVVLTLPAAVDVAGADDSRPQAVVRLDNGRTGAIVRHVLQISGIDLDGVPAESADILFSDDGPEALEFARAWRKRRSHGSLVVVGVPRESRRAAWATLGAIELDRPEEFEAIRGVVGRVLAVQGQ